MSATPARGSERSSCPRVRAIPAGTAGTTRKHGGLGLGLAIVRHLVEAHGGTVAVDSEGEGLGATFTVHFPVHAVRRPLRATGGEAEERGSALSGLSILVVDDERDAREFLATLLSVHGATVELAASAGEALGIIAGRHIDVLLADLGLPGRDGYALIQAIRSLHPDRGGAVPAVAVTAYAGLRERSRAFEVGYRLARREARRSRPVAQRRLRCRDGRDKYDRLARHSAKRDGG